MLQCDAWSFDDLFYALMYCMNWCRAGLISQSRNATMKSSQISAMASTPKWFFIFVSLCLRQEAVWNHRYSAQQVFPGFPFCFHTSVSKTCLEKNCFHAAVYSQMIYSLLSKSWVARPLITPFFSRFSEESFVQKYSLLSRLRGQESLNIHLCIHDWVSETFYIFFQSPVLDWFVDRSSPAMNLGVHALVIDPLGILQSPCSVLICCLILHPAKGHRSVCKRWSNTSGCSTNRLFEVCCSYLLMPWRCACCYDGNLWLLANNDMVQGETIACTRASLMFMRISWQVRSLRSSCCIRAPESDGFQTARRLGNDIV